MLSPVVRRLAAEHGVDLGQVAGSGTGGRITRRDPKSSSPRRSQRSSPRLRAQFSEAASRISSCTSPSIRRCLLRQRLRLVRPPQPRLRLHGRGRSWSLRHHRCGPARATRFRICRVSGFDCREHDSLIANCRPRGPRSKSTSSTLRGVEQTQGGVQGARGLSLTYLPFIQSGDGRRADRLPGGQLELPTSRTRCGRCIGTVNLGYRVDLNEEGARRDDGAAPTDCGCVASPREVRRLAEKKYSQRQDPSRMIAGSDLHDHQSRPFGSFMSSADHQRAQRGDPVYGHRGQAARRRSPMATQRRHRHPPHGYLGMSWDHRAFDGSTAVMFLNRIKQSIGRPGTGSRTGRIPRLRVRLRGGRARSGVAGPLARPGCPTRRHGTLQRAIHEGRVTGRTEDDYLLLLRASTSTRSDASPRVRTCSSPRERVDRSWWRDPSRRSRR